MFNTDQKLSPRLAVLPTEKQQLPESLTNSNDELNDVSHIRWEIARQEWEHSMLADRTLERWHRESRPLRRHLKTIFGVTTWVPIIGSIFAIPMFIPFGWKVLQHWLGWILLTLGIQWIVYSFGAFWVSWCIVPLEGRRNLIMVLPQYIELFILGCHITALSVLLLVNSLITDQQGTLIFAALIILLHLLLLMVARILLVQTYASVLKLSIIILLGTAILLYYISFTSIDLKNFNIMNRHWWTSFFIPSIIISLSTIVASIYFIQLGKRCLQIPSMGKALSWEFSFQQRFMAVVSQPPFLLTRQSKSNIISQNIRHHPEDELSHTTETSPLKDKEDTVNEFKSYSGRIESLIKTENLNDIKEPHTTRIVHPNKKTVNQEHLRLLKGIKQGIFFASIGSLLLSISFLFQGVYLSRHLITSTEMISLKDLYATNKPTKSVAFQKIKQPVFNTIPITAQHSINSDSVYHGTVLSKDDPSFSGFLQLDIDAYPESLFHLRKKKKNNSDIPGFIQQNDKTQTNKRENLFDDFFIAEHIVGSSKSWWVWVSFLIGGSLFLTPYMIHLFGGWIEYTIFSFLSSSNKNYMTDLRLPDVNLLSDDLSIHSEKRVLFEQFIKNCEKHGYNLFMRPHFKGCYKLPKHTEEL